MLLFAQQSALTHAVWHAAVAHGSASAPADETRHDDGRAAGASALCALDLAFGTVLGAIPGAAGLAPGGTAVADHLLRPLHSRSSAEPVRAVSRGPPAFS